jgi:hypothetical protein
MDMEKVIKGLECCINNERATPDCMGCPYAEINGICTGLHKLHGDALALLKAQEQKPISASIVDSDGGLMHWWACGNCQAPINPEDRFCHECGRPVKRE